MPDPEYVHIKILDIQAEFIEEYNLTGKDRDGWIYFEICQGCYGLPQAGILANNLLCTRLEAGGYYKAATTLVSGATNGNPSKSASLSMTLELNMWVLNTSTISWTPPRNIMGCNSTWQVTSLPVSTSNGTGSLTAFRTTILVNLHTTRLGRGTLNH